MTSVIRFATLALATLAIAGCATGGPPRTPRKVIDRALREAPYAAQPSLIVAREIEYARAAREDGQWTAFLAFASDGALLHGRNGPVLAKPVLGTLDDPEQAVQWAPRVVMMSCDGKTAVSQGRFLDPAGDVGTFVTVWERNGYSDDYKWSYDVAAKDNPQPVRDEAEDGVLVVTADDLIQGLVADCPQPGEALPDAPADLPPNTAKSEASASPDGTLIWRWAHLTDGTKRIAAHYWMDGEWQLIVNEKFAASSD